MRIGVRYQKGALGLWRGGIEQAIQLMPEMGSYAKRVQKAKRFVRAAGLPKVERYFRWVSALQHEDKQELYSAEFSRELERFDASDVLKPWFAKANGSGVLDATLLTATMTYLPND